MWGSIYDLVCRAERLTDWQEWLYLQLMYINDLKIYSFIHAIIVPFQLCSSIHFFKLNKTWIQPILFTPVTKSLKNSLWSLICEVAFFLFLSSLLQIPQWKLGHFQILMFFLPKSSGPLAYITVSKTWYPKCHDYPASLTQTPVVWLY